MPIAPNGDVESLLHAAPHEFVGMRNALVGRLKKAGRFEEAATVSGLRRPSPALWAVNQLALGYPRDLDAFVTAAEQLGKTQFVRGGGDRSKQAAMRQRKAVDNLVTLATEILSRTQFLTTPAILPRVSDTLLAAATDNDAREELRHGRLIKEYGAPGFEAFTAMNSPRRQDLSASQQARPPGQRRKVPSREQQARAIEREDRGARVRTAKLKQTVRLRLRAERAERGVERVRHQLRRAEERAAKARRAADEAARLAAPARDRKTAGTPARVADPAPPRRR